MNKPKIISGVLYFIVVCITAGMGIKFVSATEYFTYHEQASGLNWSLIDPGLKLVYLAVFKICGAGFFTVSLSLALMIIFPFMKYNQRWSYYAIPVSAIVFWSITMATTLFVSYTTDAAAPWAGSLFCILTTILAFIISLFNKIKSA